MIGRCCSTVGVWCREEGPAHLPLVEWQFRVYLGMSKKADGSSETYDKEKDMCDDLCLDMERRRDERRYNRKLLIKREKGRDEVK